MAPTAALPTLTAEPGFPHYLEEMRRFESCHSSQPVRSSPLFASGPSKSRGFAPFAGYYAVSASRIERRKRRSHQPVSEGYFSCLVFDGAFGLRSSRSHQCAGRCEKSLWGMRTSQKYARGSTGSGYPGPGRGQVAASRRVRRFSKITMV